MGTTLMTPKQFRELAVAVLRSLPDDLDSVTAQEWIDDQESLRRVLDKTLRSTKKIVCKIYPLWVNYGRSVENEVKAGRYNWSNGNITSRNFPTRQVGKMKIKVGLVRFNHSVSTAQAICLLEKIGFLRSADLQELLAFGKKYPEIQLESSIIALNSVWRDKHNIYYRPCLSASGSKRKLDLVIDDGSKWPESYRFLAICRQLQLKINHRRR